MFYPARLLTLLAVFFWTGCSHVASPPGSHERERVDLPIPAALVPLQPSPNRLVGRVVAIDGKRGFAFVNLTTEPPSAALAEGAPLLTRTDDLRETARLKVSRYLRDHTLGTTIVSGQPNPGDEVVFFAP